MSEIDTSTTQGKIAVMTASKEGKAIQCRTRGSKGNWMDVSTLAWNWPDVDYRIKPLEFPPLPERFDGYHNPEGWTPEQFGEGFRPLAKGEDVPSWTTGVEIWSKDKQDWASVHHAGLTPSTCMYRVPVSHPFHSSPKKKVMVPLGPEDLRENMRFQHKKCENPGWFFTVVACQLDEIVCCDIRDQKFKRISFQGLQDEYQFSADYGKTWQPCEKEA